MKKSDGKIFSALKLIEALYLDKRISYEMFRNILRLERQKGNLITKVTVFGIFASGITTIYCNQIR